MSIFSPHLSIRNAAEQDTSQLANFIHFEIRVHRHLDWKPPLEWIGRQPYLVAERAGRLVAALACPPDPPQIAWIRMFAVADGLSASDAWSALWPAAREQLAGSREVVTAAVIPLQNWFEKLVERSGFVCSHEVVVMNWRGGLLPAPAIISPVMIRPMMTSDLPAVETVDAQAFTALWRHTQASLELALKQAAVATVIHSAGEVIGYQISTWTAVGAHLARLAVKPTFQGRGLGYAMLSDLFNRLGDRGITQVSVNTQHNNQASLALYEKAGFQLTGETYPVYEYQV